MLMEITEFLALQQIGAIPSNIFSLQNCSFEKHEILDLKTREIFVNVESKKWCWSNYCLTHNYTYIIVNNLRNSFNVLL